MKVYLKNQIFEELRDALAEIITEGYEGRAIARLADLKSGEIIYTGAPKVISDSILSRAEDENKVLNLISAAKSVGGENVSLDNIKRKVEAGGVYEIGIIDDTAVNVKIKILIIYNNVLDKDDVAQLKTHLKMLSLDGDIEIVDLITAIHHGNISKQEKELIQNSAVVLPIITPSFFDPNTSHLANTRLAFASGKIVVPILMKPCLYGRVQVFKDIRSYPLDNIFISVRPEKDFILNEIANSIGIITDKIHRI